MSRSALWRQEANVKERERYAEEVFQNAVEEGKNRPLKGLIALNRDDTFNLNPMLLHNISKSPYFLKCCEKIKDWNSLVDEIYYEVKHMEPWTKGAAKTPSTAFCLLVRLFTLRCSEKQMTLMLNHVDSPYIRCIGFLYLRFASDPGGVWQWFEPYLYDEEPVRIDSNFNKPEIRMGEYVRSLLTDMDYFETLLPRLPVSIEREIKVKLLQAEKIEQRAQQHMKDKDRMNYFHKLGNRIRAMYGDEENPVTWYDAVVDRVVTRDDESGLELSRPKFLVTFPEYGNTELVTLGEVDMPGSAHTSTDNLNLHHEHSRDRPYDNYDYNGRVRDNGKKKSERDVQRSDTRKLDNRYFRREDSRDGYRIERSRGYDRDENFSRRSGRWHDWERDRHISTDNYRRERSRSRSRDRSPGVPPAVSNEEELMEEVLRREREKSAAKGKAYASRPATFKESIAVSRGSATERKGSYSPEHNRHYREYGQRGNGTDANSASSASKADGSLTAPLRQKTAEEMAAIKEKRMKLMARYG